MHRTIGQTLRAAREAKGLTLLDVAHETRIPANRIMQLEGDNFAGFGSMAYAKSFLKGYSRYLGVDAREVADGLPVPVLGGPSDYRYLIETHGPWIERHERPRRKEPLAKTSGSPIPTLVGMFAIFVIAGALLGSVLVERQKSDAKLIPKVAGTPAASTAGDAATNGQPTPDSTSSALPGNKTDGQPGAPGNPRETVIRPAMLPSSVPAPDSPNTPVRRPEIVN
jgi:cytoskeletal protein RodZ